MAYTELEVQTLSPTAPNLGGIVGNQASLTGRKLKKVLFVWRRGIDGKLGSDDDFCRAIG